MPERPPRHRPHGQNAAGAFRQHSAWGAFFMPAGARKWVFMADETTSQEIAQAEQPQGETAKEIDWKAESRKWESRAKKSEAAERELEQLKAAQMTEQEKATARAEKAEAELAELKAEQARLTAAQEISERDGVPISLLKYCADVDAMNEFAKEYKASIVPTHAAAPAKTTRIVTGNDGKLNNEQIFADVAARMFNK